MNLSEVIRKGNIVYGYRNVKKAILKGKIEKVIIAKNCPRNIKLDIENVCDVKKVPYEVYDGTNMELGVACGRPHSIAVLGILKE